MSGPQHLVLVQNFSCDYNKSSDELLVDLRHALVPEESHQRSGMNRMPSLVIQNPPNGDDLRLLFKRGSFVSAEDFRVSLGEVGEVVEANWITPRPLKSRTTSFGRPEYQILKQMPVNDPVDEVGTCSLKTHSSKPIADLMSVNSFG